MYIHTYIYIYYIIYYIYVCVKKDWRKTRRKNKKVVNYSHANKRKKFILLLQNAIIPSYAR